MKWVVWLMRPLWPNSHLPAESLICDSKSVCSPQSPSFYWKNLCTRSNWLKHFTFRGSNFKSLLLTSETWLRASSSASRSGKLACWACYLMRSLSERLFVICWMTADSWKNSMLRNVSSFIQSAFLKCANHWSMKSPGSLSWSLSKFIFLTLRVKSYNSC